MCDRCNLLDKVIAKAREESGGHFTIFGFTTNFKVILETPELDTTFYFGYTENPEYLKGVIDGQDDNFFDGDVVYDREAIDSLEGSPTIEEALIKALAGNKINYKTYLESTHWYMVSERAKKGAGYRCQLCNKGGELHAHHRTYENIGHEKLSDIVVLCRKCHANFHNKE